jgi:hypothetical protein
MAFDLLLELPSELRGEKNLRVKLPMSLDLIFNYRLQISYLIRSLRQLLDYILYTFIYT